MGRIRNINNWLLPLLLSISLLMVFNATVNSHTHILADGTIVVHAHPFKMLSKTDASSEQQQGHSHSQKEFDILSAFSQIIPFVIVFSIVVAISYRSKKQPCFVFKQAVLTNHHSKSVLFRGPPVL